MMRFFQLLIAALVALSVTAGTAQAQRTHVYLLRGFMDIFSTGMDDLGAKLNRQGIQATVHNHSEFQNLAAGIIERHKKGVRENVVIIGHSLGGNDAFRMAEHLGQAKIDVPLIIAFDPTASMSVPANVSRVVNFYSSTNGWGVPIVRGPGFRGTLSNVDLSKQGEYGHTDIDKSPRLHAQSIKYVASVGGPRRSGTASTPRPIPRDKQGAAKSKANEAAKESAKGSAKESEPKSAEKGDSDKSQPVAESGTAANEAAKPAETASAQEKPAAAAEATGSTPTKEGTPAAGAAKTETAASEPAETQSSN